MRCVQNRRDCCVELLILEKCCIHGKEDRCPGIAGALLCAVLILFLAPAYAVGCADPLATETGKAEIHAGDVVCFGICDDACGFDGKWLALDTEHTNTGEPGMFLMALNLISDEKGGSLLFRDIGGDVSVSFADRRRLCGGTPRID